MTVAGFGVCLSLTWQFTQAGDDVDMFHGTRTSSNFGLVDTITLRVSYDHPLPGHTTVVAVSQR